MMKRLFGIGSIRGDAARRPVGDRTICAVGLALLFAAVPSAAQWQIVAPAPTTADLRGIDNVGNGVAWASGSNGTVLRTLDAGKSWTRCATPPDADHLDFRAVQAFDASTAIVMSIGKGPLSRLYKTTNGCQTWKLVFTNPDADGFWDGLRFWSHQSTATSSDWRSHIVGVLIGDPINGAFVIYETGDSGDTWHAWGPPKLARPAHAQVGEGVFAASNSSLTFLDSFADFAFVTGGVSGARLFSTEEHSPFDTSFWLAFSTKRLHFKRGPTSGAFSIAADGQDLMIVGGDYANVNQPGNSVFIPARFDSATKTPPHGFRSAVAYDEESNTWITVGPNGTDISTDDGRNWHPLRPDPSAGDAPDADQHWNALSLPYVVGPHGRIGILRPSAMFNPHHP